MARAVRSAAYGLACARPRVGDRGPQHVEGTVYLGALMQNKPGLLVVMVHPDDESMGCGGLIRRHSRAGVPVNLICATRGEAGWTGKPLGAKKGELATV